MSIQDTRRALRSQVFQAIKDGSDPTKVNKQISKIQKDLEYVSCAKKDKFSLEEAAANYGRYKTAPTAYICGRCNFVHFAHEAKWPEIARQKMNTPAYKQIQHDKSVKKQKSKLKPPPKMK